jgi:signal transduction histidine kinase/ActR/RegA family two-component response regulator
VGNLWRFTPLIALAAAIALLVTGLVTVYSGESAYRRQQADELRVEARILAATVVAALTFDDRNAAQIYVGALDANPEIEAAAVYDAAGQVFAAYRRADSASLPATAPGESIVAGDGSIAVTTPVTQGGAALGSVYVRGLLEPLAHRLQRYELIGLLVGMALLLIAVLGVAQASSSRVNRALAEANFGLQTQIAQREQVEEALRQAQKMEAIGQLTGGVAHDFNNILQVILGNLSNVLQRLESGRIEPSGLLRPVRAAIRGGERAAVLVAQLLAFSRRQPLQPQPLEVNRLVAGMSDLLHRTLGESIEIETVLGARVWSVLADANRLESALLNLAVNARDAMPDGGKLTIETSNSYLDEDYTASEEDVQAGQYVVIAVSDTGVGMPPDIIAKAFDPFFTTKEVGQGTGLGLSQVYGFIKQSGGHAKIYSEIGQGTTIKLYLPRLLAAQSETPGETAPEARPPQGDREVILVVEDEADVRELAVNSLQELGYEVLEAGDGPSALRQLEARGDIRLLFTDVGLPGGLNGRQLADAARRQRPELKVLFTTGYARNAIVHHGRLDPGVDLVVKPFTQAVLAARVRDALKNGETPRAG